MTPKEEQWIKDALAAMGKANVERMAETHVFVELIGDLICSRDDRDDAVAVRQEIREMIRQRQEQYLLKIEDQNPGLAARMDKDRSLLPPTEPPKP